MKFRVKTTVGGEVRFAGRPNSNVPTYYGGPAETGWWRVDLQAFEEWMDSRLNAHTFGDSVDEFIFGCEIAELEGWGDYFTSMSRYVSYRPKLKTIVSVGQINWPDVKHLPATEQLRRLRSALERALLRVCELKRKPRQFDVPAFMATVNSVAATCPVEAVVAHATSA